MAPECKSKLCHSLYTETVQIPKRVKLLLYSHFFAPSVGGVESIVLSLAAGLAEYRTSKGEREFQVTLVTQTPAADYPDHRLPFAIVRQPNLWTLWQLIRRTDIVHVAGPSLAPLALARLACKPCVVEHHGYQAICPNGLLIHQPDRSICPGHFQAGRYAECLRCQATEMPWLKSASRLLLIFLRSFLVRHATHNIAITTHVLERHRLPRSSVIYYGTEDEYRGKTSVSSPLQTSGRICFAYVGRFVPEKGIPVLLQAAQILKREGHDFEVLLVGDGPERKTLEGLIHRDDLGNLIRITGFLRGAALEEALGRVHVVVMPSLWEETAGLAAIEQLMRGRLVIASAIGGLGEVVGGAGLTFSPGNAEELSGCMKLVLKDPALISLLGLKARERARRLFLRQRMIADHARFYKGLSNAKTALQESGK